jgi:hypothetical protein
MAELSPNVVTQYSANVYRMAQQEVSRLRPFVTVLPLNGRKRTFERVKPTTAIKIEQRDSDTVITPTQFDRRAVLATAYGWSDRIDWQDNLDVLIDPTSEVVKAGASALGRVIDEIIVNDAFVGDAIEMGADEATNKVALPATQKIPVTWGGTSGSNEGLTVEKLLEVRSRFGKADIDLGAPENKIYMAVTQSQIDDLARGIEVRSRDYDAIQALLRGQTNEFLGIHFVNYSKLPTSDLSGGKSRMCAAWCKSGVVLAMQKEASMSIFQNHNKWDNWQVLATMKGGAVRLEDAKVIQVYCYEAN